MERLNSIRHFLENILFLLVSPLLGVNTYSQAWLDIKTIETESELTNIKNARGGTFGGILKSAPIAAIELFIGFGIIIVVVFVLAGSTTGSAGVFGNVTAANSFRDSGVVIAKFGSIVGLLVTLKLIQTLF
jgi:hypothetical protein